MARFTRSLTSLGVFAPCALTVALAVACAGELPDDTDDLGSGGTSMPGVGGANGGRAGSGGKAATGGTAGSGKAGTGGAPGSGGTVGGTAGATAGLGGTSAGGAGTTGGAAGNGTGGSVSSGGSSGAGGSVGTGGSVSSGGSSGAGGRTGSGGAGAGGFGFGGRGGTGGRSGSGGAGAGGSAAGSGGSGGAFVLDCEAPMPTGGTEHCGQNTQGKAGGLAWSLWTNTLNSNACMTTFDTPAFSARWNNNGDFLARVGLEFGNNGKPHAEYGTIKADFSYKKTGSAGGYSYIGMYGWTTNPCVEWYIVDDRWGTMPFDAYQATLKGTASIDGANYKLFQNKTNGTGGSRCSGVSQWDQYWSIRQSARQCGTITVSDHFKAWEAAGLTLGGLLEAKILVETGGQSGDIQFPVANVTATP